MALANRLTAVHLCWVKDFEGWTLTGAPRACEPHRGGEMRKAQRERSSMEGREERALGFMMQLLSQMCVSLGKSFTSLICPFVTCKGDQTVNSAGLA